MAKQKLRALSQKKERKTGGVSESGRGGACSVLCPRACSAQVPTVGEGELVTLRELFSIAELTDSCLEPQD